MERSEMVGIFKGISSIQSILLIAASGVYCILSMHSKGSSFLDDAMMMLLRI